MIGSICIPSHHMATSPGAFARLRSYCQAQRTDLILVHRFTLAWTEPSIQDLIWSSPIPVVFARVSDDLTPEETGRIQMPHVIPSGRSVFHGYRFYKADAVSNPGDRVVSNTSPTPNFPENTDILVLGPGKILGEVDANTLVLLPDQASASRPTANWYSGGSRRVQASTGRIGPGAYLTLRGFSESTMFYVMRPTLHGESPSGFCGWESMVRDYI